MKAAAAIELFPSGVVILSLGRISRGADIRLAANVALPARFFRTEVFRDDAGVVKSSKQTVTRYVRPTATRKHTKALSQTGI
jgi:hypothetical protein